MTDAIRFPVRVLLTSMVVTLLAPVVAIADTLPEDPPPCEVPGISCPSPPTFTVATPPAVTLPAGAPACGVCSGSGGACYSSADCPYAQTCALEEPFCDLQGHCYTDPSYSSYVDVSCFPRRAGEPDDTCRLQRAADAAQGKVLWIPQTVEVSALGYKMGCPVSGQAPGVYLRSNTIVSGGGTVRQRGSFGQECVDEQACDWCNLQGLACEKKLDFNLFRIKNASNVAFQGPLTLDVNAVALQCADNCSNGRWTSYPCEHRHAISVWDSNDVTVKSTTFLGLVGDGVYINGTGTQIPARILVQDSFFYTDPVYRNRNGVSVARGQDLLISHNYFEGMGRVPMPGAIDLESNCTSDIIRRVQVTYNTIVGHPDCFNEVGVGVSNNVAATYYSIQVDHNDISGCAQTGVLVNGSGLSTAPVVVQSNTLDLAQPSYVELASCRITDPAVYPTPPPITSRNHWGVLVVGNVAPPGTQVCGTNLTTWVKKPSHAYVDANIMDSDRDGTNMSGIASGASKLYATGNTISDFTRWGISTDPRYDAGVCPVTPPPGKPPCPSTWRTVGESTLKPTLCSNTVSGAGTAGDNNSGPIKFYGSNVNLKSNTISSSVSGVGVSLQGDQNVFRDNVFNGVSGCGDARGCIWCNPNGSVYLDSNSGAPNLTSASCMNVCP